MNNLPFAALFVLACSGCTIPTFSNPLVAPSDAKAFPELHGVYRSTDRSGNTVHYAHVGPAGDDYPEGFLRIISVFQPKDSKTAIDSLSFVGFVESIGQYHLLHIPLPRKIELDDKGPFWNKQWDVNEVGGYMIVRLAVTPGGVELSTLDDYFIAEQIATKNLNGQVIQKVRERDGFTERKIESITITADSKEVLEFLKRHVDGKLFDKPYWKFARIE